MELPLGLQGAQLALSALLGAALGLIYDLLRAVRRQWPRLTCAADVLFSLITLPALLLLGLYAGHGRFWLFFLPAIAARSAVCCCRYFRHFCA